MYQMRMEMLSSALNWNNFEMCVEKLQRSNKLSKFKFTETELTVDKKQPQEDVRGMLKPIHEGVTISFK